MAALRRCLVRSTSASTAGTSARSRSPRSWYIYAAAGPEAKVRGRRRLAAGGKTQEIRPVLGRFERPPLRVANSNGAGMLGAAGNQGGRADGRQDDHHLR